MARREEVVSMEETRKSKKVVTTTGDEASKADDQPDIIPEQYEKISVIVQETTTSDAKNTTSVEERVKSLLKPVSSETPKQFIHRVPFILRDNKDYNKYFEPRGVSVGPYHHGKHNLVPAETIKLQVVHDFIEKHPKEGNDFVSTTKNLYQVIFQEIHILRKCYDEELTKKFDDEEIAWMLFVDGCCILHYIDCYVEEKMKDLPLKDHDVAFVHLDMFLLESQLPFRVLDLLIRGSSATGMEQKQQIPMFIQRMIQTQKKTEKGWSISLERLWFALKPLFGGKKSSTVKNDQDTNKDREGVENQDNPPHLLELLRKEYVGEGKPPMKSESTKKKKWGQSDSKWLCKFLGTLIPRKGSSSGQSQPQVNKDKDLPPHQQAEWHSYRNVSELNAVGISFKPSPTNKLTDVDFKRRFFYPILKLPPITIDDSTKTRFLNLAAHEMCSTGHHYEVTSYLCFLDSLIDHPEDVKVLRDANIIHNFLGSDEEVAKLFNEITTDLVPNSEMFKEVKSEIQKHYDFQWNTWFYQMIHTHFSSPWTILAFLAAVTALGLSVAQTIYAIEAASGKCDDLCTYLKKGLHITK